MSHAIRIRRTAAAALFLGCLHASFTVPASAAAAPDDVEIGAPAPAIDLAELLQAPDGASADVADLKGQVVMLEFWATWCAPCIAAMPHVNQLHDRFADRGVRFISITNEAPTIVRPFLESGNLRTWVGLDRDGATHKAYAITAIPTTVLIDRAGNVAAYTSPDKVTDEVLTNLLEGRPIDLPVQKVIPPSLSWHEPGSGDLTEPLAQVIIKESRATSGRMFGRGGGQIVADGMHPRILITAAYDLSDFEIDWQVPDDGRRYRLSAIAPGQDPEKLRRMLRFMVEATLDLQTRWETRPARAAILKRIEGPDAPPLPRSDSTATDGWVAGGRAMMTGGTMDEFTHYIQVNVLRMPVVNETGLDGRFDFHGEWERGNEAAFLEALKGFGLRVEFTERPLKVLIVEPATAAKNGGPEAKSAVTSGE